ncbi:MAG: YihY/virulence factor BrkB family protein [Flavobacteriales bacterium]|nr:YihY/virulence factor BrkB family protein [Flavobacteriales bacterium]
MTNTLKDRILKNPFVERVLSVLNKLVLPGFNGIPFLSVLKFFIRGIQNGDLSTNASALAFNFFIAIFPGIIFLFTLIAYIPIDNFQALLIDLLEDIMPKEAFEITKTTLMDIINRPRGGLLSFGFIMAAYFSTNGVASMINAFNNSYNITEQRSGLMQRVSAILLTFTLLLLLVVSISLLVFSEIAIQYLGEMTRIDSDIYIYAIMLGKWLIMLSLFFFGISLLYYFGPAKTKNWRFISAGSTLATVLTIIVSMGFAYFINNFGQYNKLYGSIGTLIVILLWLFINSFILLIGFELNASIGSAKKKDILD